MSTENNGYLDSDQTIVNFAVRELGISFEQLLNDDPNRMLRNWLKCRKTAKGTAIGTTIMGAIGVMGAVVTGATPLLVAGLAVAAVSGLMVRQHSSGAAACEAEMGILDECRPILGLMVQLERRGANPSDLVSTYDRLIRMASTNHIDVQDKDKLQLFFQRELEQVAVFSKVADGMQVQDRALPASDEPEQQDEPQDSKPDGAIQAAVYLPATAVQQSASSTPTPTDDRYAWAKDLLNFPAVLIWGSQGSGKTSFAAWLLRQRIQAGHQARVFDPHASYGQWSGLKVVGAGMNFSACDIAMQDFISRVKAEYQARSKQPNYKPTRETTLVDEFTQWAANCSHSGEFFITALSDIRKIQKGVIFISHDRSLAGLGGAKGFSQARDNGLAELHLYSLVDPKTGEPRPAMKGKLKIPGKAAIEVEISLQMNGSMNFTDVLPAASDLSQQRAKLEDLYGFTGETTGETSGEIISPQIETGETVKRDGETGETPYTARDAAPGKAGEIISPNGETTGETTHFTPDRVSRIGEMKRNGLTQTQIISIEWGVKPGKAQAYLDAVAEYKAIIDRYWKDEGNAGDRN